MKKTLLAIVGVLVAGALPASAADLAARPYTKAPPPIVSPLYNWSGFYLGINGGGGWNRSSWDIAGFDEGSHTGSGGTVGGQIGYRWQFGTWVFGLEGQGNWADISGSNANILFPALNDHSKVEAFGLFTGQIGYAFDAALLYVKGGAAVTGNKYKTVVAATGALNDSGKDTRWGGTVGVGLEYAFAPNWSVGVEYDHIFIGGHDVDFFTPAGALVSTDHIKSGIDLVTARINYRWGGPVLARY
ncbi:outer membrane protein [Bradyrhizobium sp. WD16]|uniref:outer membrane protein n=1 Tax=Bradyrhizobium sp. WD16 TaxID=1521768 RepID=UPI0020A457AB|nr:outer membrane beta-barrel protein [Bradyrhizobium sp. WD16]UTD26867.1 hypothetical protein DB459_07995 [Bradyrhizobium sp. WD16]